MACLEERKLLVKILKSKRFPQQDLIDADKFLTFALARGVSADVRLLEAFEKEGVFYPVVCCRAPLVRYIVDRQHPDGRPRARVPLTEGPAGEQETVDVPRAFWFSPRVLSALDNGLKVVWPGTGRFVPWAKQQDAMTRRPHLWRCYHPYQLLWFRRVVTRTTARERLVMREVDRRLLSPRAVRRARALEVLREEHPRHLRELALLVAAEDAYLPAVRRVVHLGTESYEEWDDWRGHRSPQALVDLVGYTVDEVTNLRHRAASNGSAIDPNANFDILLREVTRSELGHLRDDALAAWQYYEAADLLGSLLSDLTGEAQPETPELVHGPWLRVRMREDVGGNTDARQTVLRYYGLDPRVRVSMTGGTA